MKTQADIYLHDLRSLYEEVESDNHEKEVAILDDPHLQDLYKRAVEAEPELEPFVHALGSLFTRGGEYLDRYHQLAQNILCPDKED